MKKDFYEIMENYNPEAELFSVSKESIKEKAMYKIGQRKPEKRFSAKRIFTSIPAVAAMMCFLAGAGVIAYELSTIDRAENYFEEHTANEQIFDENDRNALNNAFKEEVTSVESNGTTIELTGSMYDENVAYFFFTMTAPEGTILDEENYGFELFDLKHGHNSAYGGAGASIEFNDDNLTDNITYFTIKLHSNGLTVQDFFEFRLENMYSLNKRYSLDDYIVKGEWAIPLKSDVYAESIELVDESFKFYTDTRYYRIDNIKISPISILVYGSFDMSTEDVNISLIMKDGSVYDDIGFGHGGAVTFSGQYTTSYALGKPIDLSAVKSIKLNDTEISVENKYSEKYESTAETIQ